MILPTAPEYAVLEVMCERGGIEMRQVFATEVVRHGAETLKPKITSTRRKNILGDVLQVGCFKVKEE